MNRVTCILGGLAALAAISCNANDTRTTVRYSILEDPGTTPADIKSWEAYAFVFSGGICTFSGYWQELSELTGITAWTDDLVTVVAAESMENLGLPVLEPGEEASLHSEIRDFDLLRIDEIAGLMLYSEHQAVPTDSAGYWSSTYNGVSLSRSGIPHSAISDKQKKFLSEDNLRAVLLVRAESPRIAAEWNNNLQAFCEGIGHGIPVNISSDPRHEAEAFAEFNAGSGGKISQWPCQLGLAATFDP